MKSKRVGSPVGDVGHETEEQVFFKKRNGIILFMVLLPKANVVQGNVPCGRHDWVSRPPICFLLLPWEQHSNLYLDK